MVHPRAHLNSFLASLCSPEKAYKLVDLALRQPYKVVKLYVVTHEKHGDSLKCDLIIDGNVRNVFLPKRFLALTEGGQHSLIQSEIDSGRKLYWLRYLGPAERNSSHVQLYVGNEAGIEVSEN